MLSFEVTRVEARKAVMNHTAGYTSQRTNAQAL